MIKTLQAFWSILKLYWLGEEKKGAWTMLAALVFLLLLSIHIQASLIQESGKFLTALSQKNAENFWQAILILFGLRIFFSPVQAAFTYIQNKLALYWRRYLTSFFIRGYFNNQAFYKIGNLNLEIDNPDQRITEDINNFSIVTLNYSLHIFRTIVQLITFSLILWESSYILAIILLIYALFGLTLSPILFGKKLIKLNIQQLKKEADFRFGL